MVKSITQNILLPPESNPFSSSAKLLDSLTLGWYLVTLTGCLTTDWVSPADIFTLRGSVKVNGRKKQKNDKRHSKHTWSVTEINREPKLDLTHNATAVVLQEKGPQEQANNAAYSKAHQ